MSNLVNKNMDSMLSSFKDNEDSLMKVRQELFKIPRMKLGQKGSPGVESGLAKTGDFFIETAGLRVGPEASIIPLMIRESAALSSQDGKIVCSTKDLLRNQDGDLCSKCPHNSYWDAWGEKDSEGRRKAPDCKASFDIICMIKTEEGSWYGRPTIFSLRKSSYPAGRKFVNLVANDPMYSKYGVPFCTEYKFISEEGKNDANQKFRIVSPDNIKFERLSEEFVAENIIPVMNQLMKKKKEGKIEEEREDDPPI